MPDTPLNAAVPLEHELELSLAITTAGNLIRRYPLSDRGDLFSRAVCALLRASDAPCLVTVLHADEANADALVTATAGNA